MSVEQRDRTSLPGIDINLIISTFGLKGPPKCSGLNVVRYSPETLHKEFGDNFVMMETFDEVHDTPSKVQQNFIYCRFTKKI